MRKSGGNLTSGLAKSPLKLLKTHHQTLEEPQPR